MGSNGSKPNSSGTEKTETPSKTAGVDDPRSPTPEIARTPLQNKPGGKHNITKNVDLRKTFENGNSEEKLIHNNPILSAVIRNHLQAYDPRSPSQDFVRTPIVITNKGSNTNDLENCNENENNEDKCDSCSEAITSPELVVPKNLCNGFFDLSIDDTLKETDEPLGSSTASNETLENVSDTEKPAQLLETNFDYVQPEESQENEISEPISAIKNIPLFKILDTDPRSPSIGIERTPIVVAKAEDDSEDNVEDMSDDSLIKVLQNTNAELRQGVSTQPEGLLIYEDNTTNTTDLNVTPKKSKSIGLYNSGSRTPLSCMKNKDSNHTRSKSANTVFDPKDQKVSKIPKRVSHIPRLKSLQTKVVPTVSSVSLRNITNATTGDCENTPPQSHRDRWDKDSSIVL